MDELNLGDLDFEFDNSSLFDDETGKPEAKPGGDPPPADTSGNSSAGNAEGDNPPGTGKNTNTDGDGTGDTSDQESGSSQSKENNQVQGGKTSPNGEGGNSSSPKLNETEQLYSNLAAEFKAKGVLPELEDVSKIKSMEDLNNAIKSHIDSGLTERQKALEEAKNAGVNVNEVSQKIDTLDKLKSITPEFVRDDANVEFRRTAIAQDFIDKGYGEERAKALAQRSIDAGTDVEDAEFALKNLIESEQKGVDKLINDAKKKEEDSLNDIKGYISDTPQVIPGITLTDSQKDELYNQITTDLGNKENAFMQAQKQDPIGSRIKLETIFYLTKGLTDFSVFGAGTETKITNNIENLLRGAKFTDQGTLDTNLSQDNNSNFTLSDMKDLEIDV